MCPVGKCLLTKIPPQTRIYFCNPFYARCAHIATERLHQVLCLRFGTFRTHDLFDLMECLLLFDESILGCGSVSMTLHDVSDMASQITGNLTVYSSDSAGSQRRHQGSTLLVLCEGNHWLPVEFRQEGPVIREAFPCRREMLPWWRHQMETFSA